MSKLSHKQLVDKLVKEKYVLTDFTLINKGTYTKEDSDWNYKDVPHLNIIHQNVSCFQAIVGDDFVGSINFLKLPFINITLPLIFVNYEFEPMSQIYISSFGPLIIIVETTSKVDSGKTIVSTNFSILSRKLFKFLHFFVKKMIIKNNEILMSEDIPMRERRADLRTSSHDFYNPSNTYSFKFTEEIYRANLFVKNREPYIDIPLKKIQECKDGDKIGDNEGIFSFFVTEQNGLKMLWPTTCPHEGAKMDKNCISNKRLLCPWHHRRIDRVLEYGPNGIKYIPSIDFCCVDNVSNIRIYYRNNPEYYDTKPYEIFKKNI